MNHRRIWIGSSHSAEGVGARALKYEVRAPIFLLSRPANSPHLASASNCSSLGFNEMACNQANEVRFSCNYWKPDPSMTESSLFLHLSKPQFPRDNMVERGETFGLKCFKTIKIYEILMKISSKSTKQHKITGKMRFYRLKSVPENHEKSREMSESRLESNSIK